MDKKQLQEAIAALKDKRTVKVWGDKVEVKDILSPDEYNTIIQVLEEKLNPWRPIETV